MLVTDEYTDVVHMCRCVFGHDLGQARSRDRGEGDAHVRNPKWPPANFTVFVTFHLELMDIITNICWNMPNPCQIKYFRYVNYGIYTHNMEATGLSQ